MIKAVLFDVDGTLVDSNDVHAYAWLDALRGHGIDVPLAHIRSRIGMGGDKLLREVANIEDTSVLGQSIIERRLALIKGHYLGDLVPLPGARALVERCKRRAAVAVVSSAKGVELADLLREAGVADLFEVLVTSDDADRSKPDPDLVQVALERLGVAPDEAMFIGDTPYDVKAARRAGVPILAMRSGGWSDADLGGATGIYDDAAHLVANFDSSPVMGGAGESATRIRTPRRTRATG